MASAADKKLAELGYQPEIESSPAALYLPVVVDGSTIYASGAVPVQGKEVVCRGKVPSQVSIYEAQQAAALCAANILRAVRREVESLDAIERVIRVTGYVNADADFTEPHLVVNGASQLFIDVFGELGKHARSAVGAAQLPLGASVEVEAILRLKA